MRSPQIVIREADGWVARQLHEAATEHRWLIREPKSTTEALSLAREARPTLLVVQVEPAGEEPAAFALIAEVARCNPAVPTIAVSDTKLPDAERIAWTAAIFDLGAAFALFPPLSKSILEDAATGLLLAAIRRAQTGGTAS